MDGYGNMGGWGWAGMSVAFVLFVGLVVAGVLYFARTSRSSQAARLADRTPRETLDGRLARGEISSTDYQDSMTALNRSGPNR